MGTLSTTDFVDCRMQYYCISSIVFNTGKRFKEGQNREPVPP